MREFQKGQTSLINWLEKMGRRRMVQKAFRYDNRKTERLAYLQQTIGLPIGSTHYVAGEDFATDQPEIKRVIKKMGEPLGRYSFRVVPKEEYVGKLAIVKKYGITIREFSDLWREIPFKEKRKIRITPYRKKLRFACVFVISRQGVVGEFVRGSLYALTYGEEISKSGSVVRFYGREAESIQTTGGSSRDKQEISRILGYLDAKHVGDKKKMQHKGFSFSPSRVCGYYEYVEGPKGDKAFVDMNNKIIATNLQVGATIEFLEKRKKPSGVIGGLVGFSAADSITGTVQIIDETSVRDFKKGNILVCRMTSVDYLPAIKRAKAVITDEGGLLSHPSIIARELRIPSIVGAKSATSSLKSGMKVIMDFRAGTVRRY